MLSSDFYVREDVVRIAKDLIGCFLFSCRDGTTTGGMITETEAYAGVEDPASHAFGGRRTQRTEVMYQKGGIAYVYLCYGMYPLLNVVTNGEGIPHAVLIRAICPLEGVDVMQRRRGWKKALSGRAWYAYAGS